MATVGIDLGTTNSLVSVWQDDKCTLIPNNLGEYLTPSVVGIDENGEMLVGKTAKERLISHPESTVASFKRFMGTEKTFMLGNRQFTAADLSSMVLRQLKEDAEKYLGEPVEEAVISVPAYFNDFREMRRRWQESLPDLLWSVWSMSRRRQHLPIALERRRRIRPFWCLTLAEELWISRSWMHLAV